MNVSSVVTETVPRFVSGAGMLVVFSEYKLKCKVYLSGLRNLNVIVL